MRLLYGIRIIRDLVNKSALFFIPIFLYVFGQNASFLDGFGLTSIQRGLVTLAIYLFAQGFFCMVFGIPAANITAKIGHQRSIILSHFLRLLAFSALYHAKTYEPLFFVGMVFEGLQTPLFWNSYHTLFSQSALRRNVGQDLGLLQFLLQIAAVIAPALGGLLALLFGIESLFLVGLLGTLVAAIIALSMDLEEIHDSVNLTELRRWLQDKEYRSLTVAFIGRYMNDVALFTWPLYVFVLLGSVERVGYLYTTSLFMAMTLSFFVGSYIDGHRGSKRPFMVSGGFLSILWLLRSQFLTVWSIALMDFFEKLAGNFHWLYYESVILRRGKGSQALSYFAYRETTVGAAAAVFWLLFGIFFATIGQGWNGMFIFASVGVLLSLFAREREGNHGQIK